MYIFIKEKMSFDILIAYFISAEQIMNHFLNYCS